ncbi:glycine zipper 2TM domain-containing protein [Rhodanobacter sp. 115]|uniref:glycine zipper 2TM domain-containing protein n=1 Tax=Rhodanobacter sp. FW021-MT20 TaxID=1162282 RepID=UPI0034E3ED03
MRKIFVVMAAFAALVAFGGTAMAQTASAQPGVIVAIAAAPATQAQVGYGQQAVYQPQSNAGSMAGGVLGAAVGALAGRHMRGGGSWIAGGAGSAIGALVGHMVDQRANERAAQQVAYASTAGAQVIVRLDGGQTVAVFSRRGGFYPGEKVWVVGGGELVPAG